MNVITVSQLNEYVKRKFDGDYMLKNIAVSGEISNYVAHSSGHSYFSLKDKNCVLKAVMFKGNKALGLSFVPRDGMKVIAMGTVSAYPRDGVYQLYVGKLVSDGEGDLFIAFEELKKRLSDEGLFSESLKRPLPEYPETVGVITSDTGAVFHDIKNVLSRRYPLAKLMLYPSKVQGAGAAQTIIDALFRMNEDNVCDVAIIARGGGSIEDLWEFNSEKLARAVRASHIPVISAVGHETDFTICDFASDLRAPTPSAAAELCAPSADDLRLHLDSMADLLDSCISSRLADKRHELQYAAQGLFSASRAYVSESRRQMEQSCSLLRELMRERITQKKLELISTAKSLELTSPSSILERGYGIITKDGAAVGSASGLTQDDEIEIRLADGSVSARVTEVRYEI